MALDMRLMRAATLLELDPAAAAREAADILHEHPGDVMALLLLGTARRNSGSAEAADSLVQLAAVQPQSATVQLELGRTLAVQGRHAEALAALQRAAELEPNLADAWRELAAAYAINSDADACDDAYARFERLANPDQRLAEAHVALANGRLDSAEDFIRRHLAQHSQDVAAIRMLAEVNAERESYVESERLYAQCLALAPGYSRARFDLARTLHMQQKAQPMLPLLERLLKFEPKSLQYRALQASAYGLLGQNQRGMDILISLLEECPGNEALWVQYGNALRTGGRSTEAIAAYRHAAQIRPGGGEAWFCLANLKTFRFTGDDITVMQAQALAQDARADDLLQLQFALGKAMEDVGEFEASFEHYARGNALRRSSVRYDADNSGRFVDSLRTIYTRQFFAARQGWGCADRDPIFIVGLPRSGSTLLEQILASHSQVEGTRELPDIQGFALELGALERGGMSPKFARAVAALTPEQAIGLGRRYLAQTRPNRLRGTPHFIDKMPSNFLHVGLIQLILPNARIIDARRSPLACCFSNYKQHFQAGVWFSYSLEDIGRFYRKYVELMAHYDAVLPGRVHRVHYEDLVGDLEREVRTLLGYCGLPFEEQCLRFHQTQRVVQTASSEQVRRPLFAEGIEQWRNFEPWLGELKSVLGGLVLQYPQQLRPHSERES